MNANRITGPGYYPKRPTRVGVYDFLGPAHYLYLYAEDGTRVGHVPWLGSGVYRHHATSVDGMVVTWQVVDPRGGVLVTRNCAPQPTVGFEIQLANATPGRPTSAFASTYWTFTPARRTP